MKFFKIKKQILKFMILVNIETYHKYKVKFGFYNSDYSPACCMNCGCTKFNQDVKSTIGYTIAEFSEICADCGKECGYWGYGYYNPYC